MDRPTDAPGTDAARLDDIDLLAAYFPGTDRSVISTIVAAVYRRLEAFPQRSLPADA